MTERRFVTHRPASLAGKVWNAFLSQRSSLVRGPVSVPDRKLGGKCSLKNTAVHLLFD